MKIIYWFKLCCHKQAKLKALVPDEMQTRFSLIIVLLKFGLHNGATGCVAHSLVGITVNIIDRSRFALPCRQGWKIFPEAAHTVWFLRLANSYQPTTTCHHFLIQPSSFSFFFHFPFSFWISITCKSRICELLFIVEVWKEF